MSYRTSNTLKDLWGVEQQNQLTLQALGVTGSLSIRPETHIELMRTKEIITNLKTSWLLNKFSLSVL